MNGENNVKKSFAFKRIVVIFRYIYLGLINWAFFYSIYSIMRKSTLGFIIGLTSLIIFSWMSGDIINPLKLNNKELGNHTNIIAFMIQLITFLFLSLLFGIGV